jgi:beta-glucosidase
VRQARSALVMATIAFGLGAVPANAAGPRQRFRDFDGKARAILARMTLDEKVGQMTQADQEFLADDSDIATYLMGSVQSGGNSDPKSNSLDDWTEMYERYQAQSAKTRLRIPLLYGVDAVHGHSNVIGAVIFPHNVGLGATRDAALVEEIGRVTAEEVRATGINWGFAPCVTVPQDSRWGRSYEGYSQDPKVVAALGSATVRGLQRMDLQHPLSILACAKHFVGDGGTAEGTGILNGGRRYPLDRGDTRVDEATLRRIHLPGYVAAIAAGVGSIMPSFSSWNGEKCTGSHRLLTEILKEELGFDGFLISDYNAVEDLPGDYAAQVKQAALAGMDMFMAPSRYREFFATLKGLAEKGEVPMSRIDDAVVRILRVKLAMGLVEQERPLRADRRLRDTFGSAAHRALGRRAVRESVVLLKNVDGRLPLDKHLARIHVAGKSADDLGNQCGGWTISWQGQSGTPTQGTTIFAAIQQAVSPKTKVTFSKDGSGADGADVAIVVVGEEPYAEFFGDRTDLALSADDQQAIARVEAAGVPVVVVVLSGRPLILGDALANADALLAAWLPGSEGGGVADVLFGDFAPTGKLPVSWPASMDQVPVRPGGDALFAFGYGLTYASRPAGGTKLIHRTYDFRDPRTRSVVAEAH